MNDYSYWCEDVVVLGNEGNAVPSPRETRESNKKKSPRRKTKKREQCFICSSIKKQTG